MRTLSKSLVKLAKGFLPTDIEVVPHIQTKYSLETNIVQLSCHSQRNIILEKAWKNRLLGMDIGLASTGSVYIIEHLCPVLKKLLGMTVQRKKDSGWKFVWTRKGKMFTRKNEESSVIHVPDERDLEKIR